MAYMVSQMRKENDKVHMMDFSSQLASTIFSTPSPFEASNSNAFTDFCLSSASTVASERNIFKAGKVYYIRFKIHKIPQYYYS